MKTPAGPWPVYTILLATDQLVSIDSKQATLAFILDNTDYFPRHLQLQVKLRNYKHYWQTAGITWIPYDFTWNKKCDIDVQLVKF